MNFQFTHPIWLLLLVPGLAWVGWFAWKSDVHISAWRRFALTPIPRLAITPPSPVR